MARKVGAQEAELAERGALCAETAKTGLIAALKWVIAQGPGGPLVSAAIDAGVAVIAAGADKEMNGGGLEWSDTGALAETALDTAAWSLATGMAVSRFQSLYAGQKAAITRDLAARIQRTLGTSVAPSSVVQAGVSVLESHLLGSVTGAFQATAKRAAKGDLTAGDAVKMLGEEALSRATDVERFQFTVAGVTGGMAGNEAQRQHDEQKSK